VAWAWVVGFLVAAVVALTLAGLRKDDGRSVEPALSPEAAPERRGAPAGDVLDHAVEDHRRRAASVDVAEMASDVLVDLAAGSWRARCAATLEVYVRSGDLAVAGANVAVLHRVPRAPESLHVTDADGTVILEAPMGAVALRAWKDALIGDEEKIELAPYSRTTVELQLRPGGVLEGRVVDHSTREPIHGARVELTTFSPRAYVRTDASGLYRLPRHPADGSSHSLKVSADGYASLSAFLAMDETGWWEVEAPPGGQHLRGEMPPARFDVELTRAVKITGRVVGPAGQPLEDAKVTAEGYYWKADGIAGRDESSARSTSEGRFTLTGLRADIHHLLSIEHGTHARASWFLQPIGQPVLDAGTLSLEIRKSIVGFVTDFGGFPVAGAKVTLRGDDELPLLGQPFPAKASRLDAKKLVPGRERVTRTGPQGGFEFVDCASGEYELVVRRDRDTLARSRVSVHEVDVDASLDLVLPPRYSALEGRVMADGRSAAGAVVEIERYGPIAEVVTDSEGRFRVAGLDDRRAYRISATSIRPATRTNLRAEVEAWPGQPIVLHLAAEPPEADQER
jgi:hypothetical protein